MSRKPRCSHLSETKEYGRVFKTGVPVEINYVRNTERAPYMGSQFQQDIEPAGRFMVHNPDPGDLPRNWESGRVRFHNPLVIAFNTVPGNYYDETSWKARLQKQYGGKGRKLSRNILKAGHDGIVTVTVDKNCNPVDTREIVDLTVIKNG